MIIIGVDFHPEFQQIASLDTETGELQERRLVHREEVEQFYRALATVALKVGGDGSQWIRPLVRTTAGGVAVGVVDRRRRRDPEQASPQTEDRLPRCTAHSETDAEGRLSADLGAELGESGSAATALASTPSGASADSNHEPVCRRGDQ